MRRFTAILIGLLALAGILPVFAASPLTYSLGKPEIFRHVLQLDDWLMLVPVQIVPLQQVGLSDSFSVTTASGALTDPIVLTNRVYVTGNASDYTVVADGTTTITTSCTLGIDAQTMDCTGTGLGDGAHTLVVTYRSGWSAYSGNDVLIRLQKNATVVLQTPAPATGCVLVGLYLSAADVLAATLTWSSGTVNVNTTASPTLWATPHAPSRSDIDWHGDTSMASTQSTLTASLKNMLRGMENNAACGVGHAAYVTTDGITAAGAVIAVGGYELIETVIPEAFISSVQWPMMPPTPQAMSLITASDASAATTLIRTSLGSINPAFNIGLTLIGALVLGGFIFFKWRTTLWAFIGAWCVVMLGKFLFGPDVPTPLVFLPIGILFGFALMHFIIDRIFAR